HFSGRYLLCFPGPVGQRGVSHRRGSGLPGSAVWGHDDCRYLRLHQRLTGTVSSFLKGAVMDKEFIRKYCESVYPELEVTAVKCNEKYQHLKEIFKKHEDEFEKDFLQMLIFFVALY